MLEFIEIAKGVDVPDDPEYLALVWDILQHPAFQSMKNLLQHGNTTCLSHSVAVSYKSYLYCKRKKWNYHAAARAGLLHDMFLYDWHNTPFQHGRMLPHGFTHPRSACRNASMFFEVSKKEKNIILRHMWPLTPVPPSSREAFVVTMVDKACSMRETFGGSSYGKKLAPQGTRY